MQCHTDSKFSSTATRRRLSEYIDNYESLDYDTQAVHSQHVRARRSTDAPADLRVSFRAHGRRFNLRLRRDLSAFSDDFKVQCCVYVVPSWLNEPSNGSPVFCLQDDASDQRENKRVVWLTQTNGILFNQMTSITFMHC